MNECDPALLAGHVDLLRRSYRHWTGRDLITPDTAPAAAPQALNAASFALVSHDARPDPIFNYANRAALCLFEMDWETFTALPSRFSAEPAARSAREHLLAEVAARGFADDYTGVRIARSGRRFHISGATVWNLVDEQGAYRGQAALIRAWHPL